MADKFPLYLSEDELRTVAMTCNVYVSDMTNHLYRDPPSRETAELVAHRVELARGIAHAIEMSGRVHV